MELGVAGWLSVGRVAEGIKQAFCFDNGYLDR